IHVQERDPEPAACAVGARKIASERFVERALVQKPGERVGRGELQETRVRFLQLPHQLLFFPEQRLELSNRAFVVAVHLRQDAVRIEEERLELLLPRNTTTEPRGRVGHQGRDLLEDLAALPLVEPGARERRERELLLFAWIAALPDRRGALGGPGDEREAFLGRLGVVVPGDGVDQRSRQDR